MRLSDFFKLFILVVVLLAFGSFVDAQSDLSVINSVNLTNSVDVVIFYGEGCPHCHELFLFLDSLDSTTSNGSYNLNITKYEVWHNSTNQDLGKSYAKAYGLEFTGVPMFFIGSKYYEGYDESIDTLIEHQISFCSESLCYSPNEILLNNSLLETNGNESLNSGFIEKYNLQDRSLVLLSIVLGLIDGFNPCAFFILLFLLSMLVYAKSRKRMLLIGGIFVFVSGLVYFLFMSAWLNFFLVLGNIFWMTFVAGLVAAIIGLINIKDFFFLKKGVSLSVSDKNRLKLMKRMRGLLKKNNLFAVILGTIFLAIFANMYELLCTAGFPMVFTKILTLNNLSSFAYYTYLVLYNIAYVIPLFVIVLFFTFTFTTRKLSQEQGEILKLVSGVMMLLLGSLLLFSPDALSNLIAAVLLIILSILIAFLLIFIKKKFIKDVGDKGNNEKT